MAKPKVHQRLQETIDALWRVMNAETGDRGKILVGGAILDEHLADAIASCCLSDSAAHEIVGGHDKMAGGSSVRITLSYALGLVSDQERQHLDRIRRIRNAAAHFDRDGKGFDAGFSAQSTQDTIATLKLFVMDLAPYLTQPKPSGDLPDRAEVASMRFQACVLELALRLRIRTGRRQRPAINAGLSAAELSKLK